MAANELQEYLDNGNIINSVNMPRVTLPRTGMCRICIIHKNVPNVLSSIMSIISNGSANVENLINKSRKDMAYTVVDLDTKVGDAVVEKLLALNNIIRVRVI